MHCEIRLASPSDLDPIVVIDRKTIGSDSRKEMLRQAVGQGLCCTAVLDGRIRAFAVVSPRHFFGYDFIELLIVDQDCRRQGLGQALLRFCMEFRTTEKLFTSTNQSNIPMQALLNRCGFICCGFVDQLDPGDPELIYCFQGQFRGEGRDLCP